MSTPQREAEEARTDKWFAEPCRHNHEDPTDCHTCLVEEYFVLRKEFHSREQKLQAYQRAVEEVMKEKYDNVNIQDKVWWNAMVDRFHFIIRKHLEAIQ